MVRDFLGNCTLITLMVGHLTVDSYVGVIPVLFPVLISPRSRRFRYLTRSRDRLVRKVSRECR